MIKGGHFITVSFIKYVVLARCFVNPYSCPRYYEHKNACWPMLNAIPLFFISSFVSNFILVGWLHDPLRSILYSGIPFISNTSELCLK